MDKKLIYVKMFGFFDVIYKDKSIFLENASNLKALMLLKFLVVNKNKEYLPEVIADNVWPENDYFDAKKVVRTYIHRLRKILSYANRFKYNFGYDINVLNIKGSYKLELSDNVELDTDLFEKYCKAVEDESDIQTLKELFDNIIGIYQDEFMQDSPFEQWVIMYRNYYRRYFVKSVNTILAKLEAKADYVSILEICERSFKIHNLDENMNIIFLNALASMGKFNEALEHYAFFTDKIYSELSLQPSDRLRSVYEGIKNLSGRTLSDVAGDSRSNPLDERRVKELIDGAIKSYPFASTPNYAVGYIRIADSDIVDSFKFEEDDQLKSPEESLRECLDFVLRKNDMCTFFGENIAIIILSGARSDYFTNISNRIMEDFHKRYGSLKKKVLIDILPANIHE